MHTPTSRATFRSWFLSIAWTRPDRGDWRLFLIYWVIAGSFVTADYTADYPLAVAITGVAFNIVYDSLTVYILLFVLLPTFLPRKRYVAIFVSIIVFLAIDGCLYWIGYATIFNWVQRPLTPLMIMYGILGHLRSYAFLAILLLGKKFFEMQNRYLRAEKERRENELRMLKAQVDPHFLFNNLNILDVLIPRDPALAQQFLRKLSELYRYLLRHKDEDVVPLAEEWRFMTDYLFLLQQRFGGAYQFELQDLQPDDDLRFLPPGALQALLENAVKHNQGDERDPLVVYITADANQLTVSNRIRPKADQPISTGNGLTNLRARYALLTDREVVAGAQAGNFRVQLPLLQAVLASA